MARSGRRSPDKLCVPSPTCAWRRQVVVGLPAPLRPRPSGAAPDLRQQFREGGVASANSSSQLAHASESGPTCSLGCDRVSFAGPRQSAASGKSASPLPRAQPCRLPLTEVRSGGLTAYVSQREPDKGAPPRTHRRNSRPGRSAHQAVGACRFGTVPFQVDSCWITPNGLWGAKVRLLDGPTGSDHPSGCRGAEATARRTLRSLDRFRSGPSGAAERQRRPRSPSNGHFGRGRRRPLKYNQDRHLISRETYEAADARGSALGRQPSAKSTSAPFREFDPSETKLQEPWDEQTKNWTTHRAAVNFPISNLACCPARSEDDRARRTDVRL